jgi:tail tape-measure protein
MASIPTQGIRYEIAADNTDFLRAQDEARRANAKSSEDMARDWQKMSETSTKHVSRFFSSFTGFLPGIPGQVARVANSFQGLVSQVSDLGGKADDFEARLGEDLTARIKGVTNAFEELRGSVTAVFWGTLSNFESTPLGQAVTAAAERVKDLIRFTQGLAEQRLPVAERSDAALAEQLRAARVEAERLITLREELRAAGPGFLERWGIGPTSAGHIEEFNRQLAELQKRAEEIQREQTRREGEGLVVGHLQVAEIDKIIEAMKKQTLELRIQADTFNMATGEAARYGAQLRAIEAAGGEDRFALLGADQRRRLTEAQNELSTQRQRVTDAERGKRTGESWERIKTSMDQEIERLVAQQRTLTMTAEAAARYNFEQREMLKLQQARIKPTEEMIAKIKEEAAEFGRQTEALKTLQRQMQIVEAYGQAFGRSIEKAFSNWLSGAKQSWKEFFNGLASEIATLTLRTQILQPLFGGGGVTGGGLFGSLFSGLFGTPKAAGGPVSSGVAYPVGEKGPELFVPRQSGTIVPNSALRGSGGGATINMRVDLTGANGDEAIARISRQAATAAAVQAVQAANAGYAARGRQLQMLGA